MLPLELAALLWRCLLWRSFNITVTAAAPLLGPYDAAEAATDAEALRSAAFINSDEASAPVAF